MRDRRAPGKGAPAKTPARTLVEKRLDLDGRRAVLAAEKVKAAVSPPPPSRGPGKVKSLGPEADPRTPPKLVDGFDAVRLALIFGTASVAKDPGDWQIPGDSLAARLLEPENPWDLRGTTCWDLFDSLGDMDADSLCELLWEYQVRPVLTARLFCANTDLEARQRARREAERLCGLVGIDFDPFWAEVCAEKPEPKAWAKAEKPRDGKRKPSKRDGKPKTSRKAGAKR